MLFGTNTTGPMGRTYKRNDLHNSRRPKSIREKRQFNHTKKATDYTDEFSTDKQLKHPQRFDPSDYE